MIKCLCVSARNEMYGDKINLCSVNNYGVFYYQKVSFPFGKYVQRVKSILQENLHNSLYDGVLFD